MKDRAMKIARRSHIDLAHLGLVDRLGAGIKPNGDVGMRLHELRETRAEPFRRNARRVMQLQSLGLVFQRHLSTSCLHDVKDTLRAIKKALAFFG